jgi:hypothetical protein
MTDAGKARSAKNALKHGMTAASSAPLPDEDPDAYTNALQEWFDDLQPVGVAERTWVERACRAAFNLDRCARSDDAVIANRTRHATQDFMNDEHARAEKLGLKLVHDPIGRCSFPTKDPAVLKLMAIRVAADPPELRRTLESFLEGVDWLLNRWSILIRILETEGYWHYPEKFDAIRLLGRRPEDVLHDPVVDRIMVSCNVLHPHRWELKDDCIQATLNLKGHPIYDPRVHHLEGRGPATPELAWKELRAIAAAEVARLVHLKRTVVGPLAALDRAEARAPR